MSDDVTPLIEFHERRLQRAIGASIDPADYAEWQHSHGFSPEDGKVRCTPCAVAELADRLATAEAVVEEFRKPEYHDHRANHVFPCRACAVLATHDATRTKETSRDPEAG